MGIILDLAAFAVKLLRKPLEGLGLLLCRDRIDALEYDLAAFKARAAEAERKLGEVKRENVAQVGEVRRLQDELARRADYRLVDVYGGHVAYALRADRARPGDVPRLLCPVCFERGRTVDLLHPSRIINKLTKHAQPITEFKCPYIDCAYAFIAPLKAGKQAFKFAD